MKMLNRQEVFDRVVNHFSVQSRPATLGACRYRRPLEKSVLMCAIGCLINDDNYSKSLEGQTVLSEGVTRAVSKSLDCKISEDDKEFLYRLQSIHDSCFDLDLFKKHLINMANNYHLVSTQVDKITKWSH